MERVVRAAAELRTLCDSPNKQFDANSTVVADKLQALYRSLEQLSQTEKMLPPDIANYVNAPIFSLLQKDKLGDRQTEFVLKVLRFLFQFPWSNSLSLSMAKQYISVCVYIIAPIKEGQSPEDALKLASVEVRGAGFQCLTAIFKDAHNLGFSKELQGPQINGLVVLCLNGVKIGKEESDQLAALELLRTLLSTVVTNIQAVLPNTASVLNNFIIGGYGYKHTAPRIAAIEILTTLLASGLCTPSEWTTNASIQVDKMLSKMSKDLSSYSERVRTALLQLAVNLATNCWDAIELCQSTLLDMLLVDQSQVSLLKGNKFQAALDKKMLEYMDSLPSTLNSSSASAISQIKALATYVKFKPNQIFADALVMRVQESLPPLSQTQKAMQSDTPDQNKIIKLITSRADQKMISLEDLKVGVGIDESTQLALQYLLESLGSTNCSAALLANLLEQLDSESGLASVQSLWIASCMIRGSNSLDIAGDYLSYCYSMLDNSTSLVEHKKPTPSIVALNTYLIGELAQDPAVNFQQHLVDGLFPVVDLLGSGHTLVISEAKTALAKIAQGCGYEDVKELILENKDYVLDGISSKLNTMDITPATLTMLAVLILMTGNEIVVYLDDIVNSLFIIIDRYHGYSSLVTGIFGVFSAIIEVMTRTTLPQIQPAPKTSSPLSLAQLKEELTRKPQIDLDLKEPPPDLPPNGDDPQGDDIASDNESNKDDFEPPMDTETDEWDAPIEKPVFMIAKRIFDKCTLFLTHPSASLQSNILKVASQCISVLSYNQKEFLPAINAIWPVVSARVTDEEVFVCESAFKSIGDICASAGDFMSSRVEDLWNKKLLEFKGADFYSRTWPDFSPEKRWINALAACLQRTLMHVRLDFETFDSILWTLAPIVKGNKPLRESFEAINADDVWLCLTA